MYSSVHRPSSPSVTQSSSSYSDAHLQVLNKVFGLLHRSFAVFLGSVLSLSPPILRALDQLGLMEELKKISMPCAELTIVDANLQTIGVINPGKNDMAM